MGRVGLAVLATAVAVLATACGERGEPTGPSGALYPVTIGQGDKALVLQHPARHIAVLAPSVDLILAELGAAFRVAGTPLAPNGTVRIPDLRALEPDLIVASSTTDLRQRGRAGEAVRGVPIYTAPDDSILGVERTITQLGLITDQPVAARRLVRRIEAARATVRAKLAGLPSVSVFLDAGFFTTVSNQSLVGDMLREVHARNVAGTTVQTGPFDLLELARIDPHFYLTTSDSSTTLALLQRNPKTRKLGSVAAGRFAIVDAALLEPGPSLGEGLLELARILHPDAFH